MPLLASRTVPKAYLLARLRWVDLGGMSLLGLSSLLYVGAGWSWRASWVFELLLIVLGLNSAALVLLRRSAGQARPWRLDRLLGQSIAFVLGAPWLLSSMANPRSSTIYQTETLTVTAKPHFSFSLQLNMNESYVGNDVSLFTRRLWLFEQKAGTFYQPPSTPAYAGALPDLATSAGWLKVRAVMDDTGRGLHLTDLNGHKLPIFFE
jgi:hypothetical protein